MKSKTQRRRVDRARADWGARFSVDGAETWMQCRVLDVSLRGAALELSVGATEPDGSLVVELPVVDAGASGIQLRAEVRNRGRTPAGLGRVGVAFLDPTDREIEVLSELISRHATWGRDMSKGPFEAVGEHSPRVGSDAPEIGGGSALRIEWYCADGHVVDSYQDDGRDRFDADGRPLQYRLPLMFGCIGPWDAELGVWCHECGLPLSYQRAGEAS